MNEQVLTNEIEVNDINDVVALEETPTNKSSKTVIGVLLLGAGAIAVGTLIAKAIRNKKKQNPKKQDALDKMAEERLLKKGYTIVPPFDEFDEEIEKKVGVEK